MDKRKKTYLIIFWILTGLVLEMMCYYTSLNGFMDLAFSRSDAVYDVGKVALESGEMTDKSYCVSFPVFQRGSEFNYLCVSVKPNSSDNRDLKMSYVSADKNGAIIEVITDIEIREGVNTVKLESNTFDFVTITITGLSKNSVEDVQFRELAEDIKSPNSKKYMFLLGLSYVIILIAADRTLSAFYKERTSQTAAKRHNDVSLN